MDFLIAQLLRFAPIDDRSRCYTVWSSVVALGVLYNVLTLPMLIFDEFYAFNYGFWLQGNLLFDLVFLLDILVQAKREFYQHGMIVKESAVLAKHYFDGRGFLFDLGAIVPTDLLLLRWPRLSAIRANRLLKLYRLVEFVELVETRSSHYLLIRLFRLALVCFTIFHWNGAIYSFLSKFYSIEGESLTGWIFSFYKIPDLLYALDCDPRFSQQSAVDVSSRCLLNESHWKEESDSRESHLQDLVAHWMGRVGRMSFSNLTKRYGQAFYWSTLTLVTLGEQPWPNNSVEGVFEIGCTIFGLIMLAVMIGSIGTVVTNMNATKTKFEELADGCARYLKFRRVDKQMEGRVNNWLKYFWNEGLGFDKEQNVLDLLPSGLKTELLSQAHLGTLREVPLFESCEEGFLAELANKLELHTFLPGDYVCRRGEIGRELFVVKSGHLEAVLGVKAGCDILSTLRVGDAFGELSLLKFPSDGHTNHTGRSRRRAVSVRSIGFSELYRIGEGDLWTATEFFPESRRRIITRGLFLQQLFNEEEKLNRGYVNEDALAAMLGHGGKADQTNTFGDGEVEAVIHEKDAAQSIVKQLARLHSMVEELTDSVDKYEANFKASSVNLKQKLYSVERRYKSLVDRGEEKTNRSTEPTEKYC